MGMTYAQLEAEVERLTREHCALYAAYARLAFDPLPPVVQIERPLVMECGGGGGSPGRTQAR